MSQTLEIQMADEVFLGYDLFKETAVRTFWARQPKSIHRPRLFARLYPYLPLSSQSPAMLQQFYAPGLERAWLPGRDDIAAAIRRLVAA